MLNLWSKPALFLLVGAIALGLLAAAWAMGAGSSEAQPGAIQNCPQAGKWAISVWDGPSGTDTGQALDTCGAGAVSAAYYLDPNTQGWLRWFSGRPEVTNLNTLNDKQGIIALGATGTQPPAATPTATPPATPTATPVATETPMPSAVEPIPGAAYTGTTSQNLPVKLTVADDGAHIQEWHVEFSWSNCEGGDTRGVAYPVGIPIERNGFADSGQEDVGTRQSWDFSGVFQSSELVAGEARFTEEIEGTECDSGIIEWNAAPQ